MRDSTIAMVWPQVKKRRLRWKQDHEDGCRKEKEVDRGNSGKIKEDVKAIKEDMKELGPVKEHAMERTRWKQRICTS